MLHSRDEIKDIITLNGGKIVSSVSAQTNLIVAGENMGPSKLAKAKRLDIEILTETEFLSQLGQIKIHLLKTLLVKSPYSNGFTIFMIVITAHETFIY